MTYINSSPPALAALNDPMLIDAYHFAVEQNILASLNPDVFFGYFSVCASGGGHGTNTTYPGLDWGQTAEALLWLGRFAEVLASWQYVRTFLREDGLLPFAILPNLAGQTVPVYEKYQLNVSANGGLYVHWMPGNPLYCLANVTFLQMAAAIDDHLHNDAWLVQQAEVLTLATQWLLDQVTVDGLMPGGGLYLERPTRLDYDGVAQCLTARTLQVAAPLLRRTGNETLAGLSLEVAEKMTSCFREQFWMGDHCVEYIHPEHGPISHHGLTDVDWAALATGMASDEQVAILWPQLRAATEFIYNGIPTGISTRPETYEDWEVQHLDRHDLSAMGRVWYLECWARSRMGDREGIINSLRRVAEIGRNNNWSWRERYYSEHTGDLAAYNIENYCEYPANLIRIVNQFL
jgi:hypothetical protein